jgi:regulator of protease activity HflC (stomatin/prohibitin superfamily)
MGVRFLPILAAISGFAASVEAGIPTDPGTLEAIGKWPITIVLGAVCVATSYLSYLQSKNSADRAAQTAKDNAERDAIKSELHCKTILAMAEGERIAAEKRNVANANVVKDLAESNSKATREVAENNAKEIKVLIEQIVKART